MPLDLRDCSFFGPALPEPFVKFQLESELQKQKLLPKSTGDEGRALQDRWEVYRRKLRGLGEQGGDRRVASHVLEPLTERLGYEGFERQAAVITREGPEDGGWLFTAADGRALRAWSVSLGTDLDAPSRRGRAYRFSPSRVAQRVLLASSERLGLLTDGEELRLLLCDPARPDSHIAVRLDRSGGWRAAPSVPDSYRLTLALASSDGVAALPDLAEAARLAQSTVTKKLRLQARHAIEGFLQELLDHPENTAVRAEWGDPAVLARALWCEGLILVYRLLFIFKLESSADPARAFSFAATSLWRNTYSPNTALADLVRRVLDQGADSGGFLEGGLRTLWRMFSDGMSSSELEVKPLGGMLFGEGATPLLDRLYWGERGVARLLDALLWTPGDGRTERERVHYGALDVEDLGRVYEALLELEPGITTEPMCRLRRAKLEVVVPVAQGAPYRTDLPRAELNEVDDTEEDDDATDEDEAPKRRGKPAKSGKTKVQFIEEIPAGRFFLRVGLGRKASGSYYTPHPFVRFLVQETLGPQLVERSPKEDPHPGKILELKVLDPAMGSGHFLVEVCRYLGEALYEACRLCDELAVQAEEQAEKATDTERERLLADAAELRQRVEDLPDPEDELVAYLPSRASEGEESGLSQKKAEALCRRLVAVHCLYGVDKNPLAVELAKLSLWLESYAEGLPLTFMDHRLVQGDSLTGPFFEQLLTYPKSGENLDDLFAQGLTARLRATLASALVHVRDLEASVGKDLADLEQKRSAKVKLDAALLPLKTLAAAWSGGVMLGDDGDDAGYRALAQAVAKGDAAGGVLVARPRLREMIAFGAEGVAFELVFPEVFHASGADRRGFDAVVGNPPWEGIQPDRRQFAAERSPVALTAPPREVADLHERLLESDPRAAKDWTAMVQQLVSNKRTLLRLARYLPKEDASRGSGAVVDYFLCFVERSQACVATRGGMWGLVLPNGFHTNLSGSILRQVLLESRSLHRVLGFSNARKLFDISPGMRFDLVIAASSKVDGSVLFGLEDPATLFSMPGTISISKLRLQPPAFAFPELASEDDLVLWQISRNASQTFGGWMLARASSIGEELHASKSSYLFYNTADVAGADPRRSRTDAAWPVHEKGTFGPYNDLRQDMPRYSVLTNELVDAKRGLRPACFYRLAHRAAIHAQEEFKSVFALLPPGVQVAHSAVVEKNPESYPYCDALHLLATANSFALNAVARARVGLNLSAYIRSDFPFAEGQGPVRRYLAHSALRLTCNHAGYAPLWAEQLGDTWREPTPRHIWPVIEGDDARWAVRAAIDAVVADAYGLDRAQYEHVLSTFSHKSYPNAPELCLSAFDELKAIGLDAFTRKHDPYWDIPLNESLPKPAIDLPGAGEEEAAHAALGPLFKWSDGEPGESPPRVGFPPHAQPSAPEPAWMARTPIDRQVLVLSRVVDAHQRANRLHTLGNVKAEKIVYLVEAQAGIDLKRAPMREAAGPADFPRLKKAVHRGAKLHAFSVRGGYGGRGGVWSPSGGLRKRLGEYEELFVAERSEIDRVIDLLVPMDSEKAEIIATLYACWNDLLARGAQTEDHAIIEEFHGWAESKRRFDTGRLERALEWMRQHGLRPTGRATPTTVRSDGKHAKIRSRGKRQEVSDDVYAVVLGLLDERGLITSGDAQQATGLDAAGVRPHLKRLLDEGRAVTEGQRRGMKYRRAPDA